MFGFFVLAVGLPSAHAARASTPLSGDPNRGKAAYSTCMACHSLDQNQAGPKHRGVVGRRAGTIVGYNYSAALKSSGIVWTPANLDRWLIDPQKMVPGAHMFFSVTDAQKRADIIAYLGQQR
jgi:cytochrome c